MWPSSNRLQGYLFNKSFALIITTILIMLLLFFFGHKEVLAGASCGQSYSRIVTRWQPVDVTNNWTASAQIGSGQQARAGILDGVSGSLVNPSCLSSWIEDQYGNIVNVPWDNNSDSGFDVYSTGTYRIYFVYLGLGSPTTEQGSTLTVSIAATPTPTPIPCPYSSLQARVQVSLDDGITYKDWTQTLNINQWQTNFVNGAVFYNNFGTLVNRPDLVQVTFNGGTLSSNPSSLSIPGVGNYTLTAQGVGICSALAPATATLNVLYCPYRQLSVNSNRNRPGDNWVPNLTINKKDSKAGRVASGVYYNNDGTNNWATINNLVFTILKPSGELASVDVNPKTWPTPPSWYTPGLYLNYPGNYTLNTTGTNNGASCGDYPPQATGTITVINCSFDTTVAGFQQVDEPPLPWLNDLTLPTTQMAARAGGFHDVTLSSISPSLQDVTTITPRRQVALKITGDNGFNLSPDQGASYTYTATGNYTLAVSTPDNDKPGCPNLLNPVDPACFEDGPGCFATAALHVNVVKPVSACIETSNKIPCCPLTPQNLFQNLVTFLTNAGAAALATAADVRMSVDVDKILLTTHRILESNHWFGTNTGTGFDPGAYFRLSPPSETARSGISDETSQQVARRSEVSVDVGFAANDQTLKKSSATDIKPISFSDRKIQGYLTTIPPVDPDQEAPFLTGTQTQCVGTGVARYMNSVITESASVGLSNVKLLSPAFNMTSNTFAPILNQMISQGARFSQLAGIAGNVYNAGGQTITYFLDQDYAAVPTLAGYPLFITETGKITGTLDDLRNELNKLKTTSPYNTRVKSALLFNGFNTNTGWTQFALTDAQITNVCSGTCGKVGINSASGFAQGDSYYSRAQGLGMQYNLEIANGPESLSSTIQGIQRANSHGLTTIIRICVGDTCGFGGPNGPATYAAFLKQIDNAVSYTVYAIAGPNEPDAETWASPNCGVTSVAGENKIETTLAYGGQGENQKSVGSVLASTTPLPGGSGASCQEFIPNDKTEVECYDSQYQNTSTLQILDLINLLQSGRDLAIKITDLDVIGHSSTGVSTADTPLGRAFTNLNIKNNAGFLELFKVPTEPDYKSVAGDAKTTPIKFTIDIGMAPPAGFPIHPLLAYLRTRGIPITGTGSVSAAVFDPLLEGCSIVYTAEAGYTGVGLPKLSCNYLIPVPQLVMRYFDSQVAAGDQDTPTDSLGNAVPIGYKPKLSPPNTDLNGVDYEQVPQTTNPDPGESFIQVTKTPSVNNIPNSSLPQNVTFTITIKAINDDLSNIRVNNNTTNTRTTGNTPITTDVNGQSITSFPTIASLSSGQSTTITYTVRTDSTMADSVISDTAVVTADVPTRSITDARASASSSVRIGTPQFCNASALARALLPPTIPARPSPNAVDSSSSYIPSIPASTFAIYQQAANATGIPCEVLGGLHWIEAHFNPAKSLVSGRTIGADEPDISGYGTKNLNRCPASNIGVPGAPIPVDTNGDGTTDGCGFSSLLDSAIYAANHLKGKIGGPPSNFNDLVRGYSRYNGGGNRNCGQGTSYAGPCPPPYGIDDPYAMAYFDDQHTNMFLIYCADLTRCSTPRSFRRDGAMAAFKELYLFLGGIP